MDDFIRRNLELCTQANEEWRPVVGYEDRYLISSEKKIFSLSKAMEIQQLWSSQGRTVRLSHHMQPRSTFLVQDLYRKAFPEKEI